MERFDATSWLSPLMLLSGEGGPWLEPQGVGWHRGRMLHGSCLKGEVLTTVRDSHLVPSQKLFGFEILSVP